MPFEPARAGSTCARPNIDGQVGAKAIQSVGFSERGLWGSLVRGPESPWEVRMDLSWASSGISSPKLGGRAPLEVYGSLRLGDSEDLRRRSEATEDLTRRREGELLQWVFFDTWLACPGILAYLGVLNHV